MQLEINSLERARILSGLTAKQAAGILGMKTYQTYRLREQSPDTFSIAELRRLYEAFGNDGKECLRSYVRIFLTCKLRLMLC